MTWLRLVGSSLFAGAGLGLIGLGITLLYEAFAYATGLVPTISGITADQLLEHPHWFVTGVLLFGIVVGALVTHFSHWTPASR